MARSTDSLDRRRFLGGAGGVLVAGALAGCTGGGGSGDGDGGGGGGGYGGGGGDGGDGGGGGGESTPTPEPTPTPTPEPSGNGGATAAVDGWLSDVDNYDGSIADATGSASVEVLVGAKGNGGFFAFDPPAVAVSAGTTVTWTWTGKGGGHSVTEKGERFDSGIQNEEGFTFERTVEKTGPVLYFCTPHKGLGMKGAVVVK